MPFEILDEEAPAAGAGGGYEVLDEETPGTLEGIANSFQRGNLAGQRALEALQFKDEKPTMRQGRRAFTSAMEDPRYSFGLLENPDKTESLLGPSARLDRMTGPARESNIATAGNIADLTQRMGAIPQSAAMQEWSKADNSNWWQVFARNPVEITANIFAESLPQASAGMAAGMAGGMAGGPAGAAAGAGTGSFVVEASNAFLDGATQAGVDLADPEQVRAFFADEAKVKEARQFAMQRGFPVALFDALTAGVAGKFLKPALGKGVGRVAAASGAEAGVQMAGGAAGETAAQVTSGQELSGKDIFAEAVGELVTAPGEVVSNLRGELKGFEVIEEGAGDKVQVSGSENVAPAVDLKGLEAAMRGNQLKPQPAPKPKADAGAAEIVMADLPEASRAQLTRRMEQGPATPESLPAPEKPGATGAATVDWNPTEEMRAALEFQKRTDEAVKAAIENPDKEYEAMTRQELELLEALGDGRATAQLRRLQQQQLRGGEVTPEGEVVLQDGKRFGQQVLTDGTTIYAEEWQSAPDETAGQLPAVEQKATEEAKAAAKAVLPKHKLSKPIHGTTGAKIIGYEWRSTMGEKWSEREGGYVDARVSDWDNADESKGTGRQIVHVYFVEHPDGRITTEGIRSAQNVLGISESRLQSIAKKAQAEQAYAAEQERLHFEALETTAEDTPAEASKKYRKANWSNFRTFEENEEVFNRSSLYEKAGRYVRTSTGPERMQERGWKAYDSRAQETPKPVAPTLKSGQKQGDLLGSGDVAFNLFAEQTQSGERIEAERQQREETERAAKEFEAKNQQELPTDDRIRDDLPEAKPILEKIERIVAMAEARHAEMQPGQTKDLTHPNDLLTSEEKGQLHALKLKLRPKSAQEARADILKRRAERLKGKDAVESALDKLKIETPPGSLQAFGLLPETWNQLIEIVRKAYRAGKTIAAAIDDGVAWLRKNAQDFDEAAIKDELRQVVGGAEARPEDTLAAQLEDLQQRLERIELNIIRTRRKGKASTVRALLDERQKLQAEFNRLRYGAEKEAVAVEGEKPAPILEFTQAQLDKVSSATLDGAPSAESFWTRVRKGLRYFATSTPEIAVTGDEAQNAAMFRRGVRLFGVETQNARRTAAREINKVLDPIKALGRDITNADAVNQFFKLGKRIRREEGRANPNEEKLAKWRAQQTKVREGLESNPWYLFQQAVLWRDLWYRGKFLRTPSGGEITLPGGLEIDQVETAMQRNQQLIDANPHGDAVRESLKRHYQLMADLQESLLKHGELIPDELRNPLYFPHHLLEKFTGSLERARPTTEKDFRAYLIAPVGSEKLIEAGYLNALYKHVNDVTAHNARADVVEKYWRPYDKAAARQQELDEEAEERGETVHPDAWKRNLPPGMDLFTPSEEIPMRADYILNRGELAKALGVALPANGDLRNALVELGAEVRLTGDMIQKALVAGERPQWLLPMEIAEAIRGVVRREEARSADTIGRRVGHVLSKPLQWWKGNTLFNWYNYPRYEWGNTITDVIDKMLGADPGMARYLGRALKEVRDAARGQRTEEFDSAEREGVLQSVTAAEVEELARLPEFEDFLTSKQWRMEKVRKFITWTARASAVRESTFRYAKFLADLERIRRGTQPVYAGAYWRDVQAAATPEAKAAEIALKTFGDYGNLSVVGNFLREHVIPFWSWQEINLKYHANLFRNLHDMLTLPIEERPQGARQAARAAAVASATFTARAAVGIALRLALMRLAVELWNQMGGAWAGLWDEDEDLEGQLSEADRRRFHLILGKDENGRVRVVYVPNALSDVAEWFGGNNFARLFTEWAKGDIPFGQFASDYGKQLPTDLVNKVVQGARPDVKFAYMATSGKDPFPDVTNQRDISRENLGWLLMQTVTDRDAATFLRQQLDKDFYAPEDLGDWLGRKLLQIRRRDAEQWAYYEIRDRAADWKEARTGKRNEGFDYQSPDQQVIRNFRKAIYRGDMENAVRFYHRLRDYGYTDKRFAASIRNSDPLSDLTKLERREFERGLTGYERELLTRAERYYGRLAASKGREKTLFPSNERSNRRASEEQIRRAINAP